MQKVNIYLVHAEVVVVNLWLTHGKLLAEFLDTFLGLIHEPKIKKKHETCGGIEPPRHTSPHKRRIALWHRLLINLPNVHQNHYCGYNNYCSSPPSLVPKGLGFCALSRHDTFPRATHTSYQSNSSRSKLK